MKLSDVLAQNPVFQVVLGDGRLGEFINGRSACSTGCESGPGDRFFGKIRNSWTGLPASAQNLTGTVHSAGAM